MSEAVARPYLVHLLVAETEPTTPLDRALLLAELERRCGAVLPPLTPPDSATGASALHFAFADHVTELADGMMPVQGLVTPLEGPVPATALASALEQTRGWDARAAIGEVASPSLLVSDLFAGGIARHARLKLFMGLVTSVLALRRCRAIVWGPSQKVVDPAMLLQSLDEDPLFAAINVRLFRVGDGAAGEVVMDTLGLEPFGLPDVQMHFVGLDPNRVAGFLHGLGRYLFQRGPVIEDGHTVPGPEGQAYRCRIEEALVAPARVVIDVEPDPLHSPRPA